MRRFIVEIGSKVLWFLVQVSQLVHPCVSLWWLVLCCWSWSSSGFCVNNQVRSLRAVSRDMNDTLVEVRRVWAYCWPAATGIDTTIKCFEVVAKIHMRVPPHTWKKHADILFHRRSKKCTLSFPDPPAYLGPALQMKSSSEPIWKQHRRMKEEQGKGSGGGGGGGTSDSAAAGKAAAVGPPAGAGAGGNRESEIQTGRKLTQRLAKAGVEGKFNKEEVLEILQKVRKRGARSGEAVGGRGRARV